MVHENRRLQAYYREAASWLRAGAIGTPFAARLAVLTGGTPPDAGGRFPTLERQPFMRAEARIHHLDTLRMLLGPLQVTACTMSRICEALAGEDRALIQLRAADGLAVQVFASLAGHGRTAAASDVLEILGPSGAIRLDGSDRAMAGAETGRLVEDCHRLAGRGTIQ